MTVRDLPTELFHKILDYLGCNDYDSLAACTLVCRDWLDVSRAHLFSELHVLRGRDESFEDVAEFLETRPILAGYVRILTLEARLFSITPRSSLMPSTAASLLCRILRAVPHLHEVRLRQLKIESSSLELRTAKQIHLEHLEYERCASTVSSTFALLSLFHIDHLDFDPLFEEAESSDAEVGDRPLIVGSLCIKPFTTQPLVTLKALQRVIRPNRLKSFRYSPLTHLEALPLATFLRIVGQNIIDLDIRPSSPDDYAVLSELPALAVFRYHLGVSLLTSQDNLPKQQVIVKPFRELLLPSLPSHLEQLILYIFYGDKITPGSASMPLWGSEPSLARFPRLNRLTICFPTIPDTLACAMSTAAVCFPVSHSKGILDINVRVWELECREWDLYGYLREEC